MVLSLTPHIASAPLTGALEQHTLCRCLVYWCFGETRRVTWVSNSVFRYYNDDSTTRIHTKKQYDETPAILYCPITGKEG